MRKSYLPLLLMLMIQLLACSNANEHSDTDTKAGVLIVADSMPTNDNLNEFYFCVKLETTTKSDSGVYRVVTSWGYNAGASEIAFPKGLEHAIPVLRRDSGYTYIVGFRTNDDTSFHDYYRITANGGNIEMRYIKTYFYQ